MSCRFGLLMFAWLAPLLTSAADGQIHSDGPVRMNVIIPADFRGESLENVLDQVSELAGCKYSIDSSVSSEHLRRPVRMYARHLSALQLTDWAVRLVDLEMVCLEDRLVVVAPQNWASWRWEVAPTFNMWKVGDPSAAGPSSQPAQWEKCVSKEQGNPLLTQKADIEWTDSPLSRVCRDISDRFGVDLLIHPQLRQYQPLVNFQGSSVSLGALCEVLAKQVKADIFLIGKVLWAVEHNEIWMKNRVFRRQSDISKQDWIRVGPDLERPLFVDEKVANWAAWATKLSEAGGLRCRLVSEGKGRYPDIQAKGSVREILEAARLCDLIYWSMGREQADGADIIYMQVRNNE